MVVKRESLRRQAPPVATGLDLMLALPVPQAIVTGSSREELEMVMEAIGMSENGFAAVLCDEDCARGKPDPEGYLRALDRLRGRGGRGPGLRGLPSRDRRGADGGNHRCVHLRARLPRQGARRPMSAIREFYRSLGRR